MTFRRVLFWCHLSVGLVVSLVVSFLALTGTTLAFQQQIITFAERDARYAISASDPSVCVSPSTVLSDLSNSEHAAPVSWTSFAGGVQPTEVAFAKRKVILVDPCTGRVLRRDAGRLRGFFLDVRDLHRYVAWGGVRHEGIRSIKNAINLGFIFLLVSGLILWVPRKLTRRHAQTALVPRWFGIGRASEWSLHTVVGFWLFVPLLAISLSGAIMAYAWANALLYRVAGDAPPALRAEREAKAEALPIERYGDLDPFLRLAAEQDPRWTNMLLRLPPAKSKEITITLEEGDGRDPRTKSQLVMNRKNGKVIRWERFSDNTKGRRWRLYARFLHTGELFGSFGQLVAFLTMMGLLLLVCTGISLSLRRFAAWRTRRQRARHSRRPAEAVAAR